jgi:cytochrome c551/c552
MKKAFFKIIKTVIAGSFVIGLGSFLTAPNRPVSELTEDDYFKIIRIPTPEGIVAEVGGMVTLPNGDLAFGTRRGDVYIIENPSSAAPNFKKFASGLHEILGLEYKDGNFFCAQRGELTKLVDRNGDGKCDRYETVYAWPISGHYHEYSFGPKILKDGSFMVSANLGFGSSDWWAGKSFVPWRGWTMRITEDGKMEPFAAGFRSPCGIGMVDGEFFYGDNQGDWMGSGFIMHVEKGDFVGHPASLNWAELPGSTVKMRKEMVLSKVDPRDNPKVKPEYIKDEAYTTIYDMAKMYPDKQIKSPTVWLPHGVLGVSTSEIITDDTKGNFGPFAGQVFVGDQGMSKIARVFLEKVNGKYQGCSFDFKSNFRSGTLRMCWGKDGAMYVGGTNRGWGSTGKEPYGLERMVWTGKMPFEMKAVRAMPDGFEIEFTQPVNKATAENVDNYTASSYTYKYHPVYGSPLVDFKENAVRGAKASPDGMRVRIVVDAMRLGYIHDIKPEGVRSAEGNPLLHVAGYYTLNAIPEGAKADIKLVTVKKKIDESKMVDKGSQVNTPDNQMKEARPNTVDGGNPAKGGEGVAMNDKKNKKDKKADKQAAAKPVIDEKEVAKLLSKWTCNACHKMNEKVVGPSFAEIAKRNYTVDQMTKLIWEPMPSNWPDFETPMAPMAHVPKKDVDKISAWIIALKK